MDRVRLDAQAAASRSVADARIDRLFDAFFDEDSARGAARAGERILGEGVTFEEALVRLETGRAYEAGVTTGEVRWVSPYSPRIGVRTLVLVPRDYDPAQAYPVRIELHGAVGREQPQRRRTQPPLESSRATIHVLPSGFAEAQWWFANQVDNLNWIVDRLKRTYNIDENHVHLLGTSDGATGVLFFAMRDTTPWSSFVALNGHPKVLTNPGLGVDGEMYATNLVNKPLYIVNGDRDLQYPASTVAPFADLFRRAGAEVTFRVKARAGHDTSWWDEEQFDVDDFVDESGRDPLPPRLSWQTERVDRYNRAHWLIITRLDPADRSAALDDVNDLRFESQADFGMRIDLKVASGRRVVEVVEGSDAARMGLRKGDTVVEVDGVRMRDGRQIAVTMQEIPNDRAIAFVVERGGQRITLFSPFPPADTAPRTETAFSRGKTSGRVDLVQRGNLVEARTRGVGAFTLLLSPRRFDFSQPVIVTVNGRETVNRVFAPNAATLLKWAAIDDDRTMLFGVELPIEVTR